MLHPNRLQSYESACLIQVLVWSVGQLKQKENRLNRLYKKHR